MLEPAPSAPLLSIVIPAYQAQASVGRLLDSILTWNGDDIEVVVVNDGSTDATQYVCDRIVAKDSRVRLVNKENGGRSSARNEGVRIARGKWLMFADSDDYLTEGWVPAVRKALKLDRGLTVFSMVRSDGLDSFGRTPVDSRKYDPVDVAASAVFESLVDGTFRSMLSASGSFEWNSCWGRLYRKSIVEEVVGVTDGKPFPEGVKFSEDRLFNLCCLKAMGTSVVRFDYSPVYYWDLGLSSTVAKVAIEDAKTLVSYGRALDTLGGVFEPKDRNQIMAMELACQFRRSATLSARGLASAAKAWKEVLDSDVPNGCWPHVAGFLGRRRWIFGLSVALLIEGRPYAALWCQHFIQRAGKMIEGCRRRRTINSRGSNLASDSI